MTELFELPRCQQIAHHEDWAMHFLGFLAAGQTAGLRELVIVGLLSAKTLYPLPAAAELILHRLVEESMDASSPY